MPASVTIQPEGVSVNAALPAKIREFLGSLDGTNRREINSAVAQHMEQVFRDYLKKIAPRNHKTANSFEPPATPTGHLEKAARNTLGTADADGVTVTVTSAGITRAFHDLNIRAKGKLLTIPARPSPEAYGKRARDLTEKLFFLKTPSGVRMLATPLKPTTGGKPYLSKPHRVKPDRPRRPGRVRMEVKQTFRPVYWLRSSVTVPQKRNILPSDSMIAREARAGYVRGIEARKQALGL